MAEECDKQKGGRRGKFMQGFWQKKNEGIRHSEGRVGTDWKIILNGS
jgi:hypothetical protein